MTAVAPDLERVLGWLRSLARDRADRVVDVPGGIGLLSTRFPAAHDHNQLLLWHDVDAQRAAAAADDLLRGAGLAHRRLWVHSAALADRLAPGLAELGYRREREVLQWRAPDRTAAPAGQVVELDLEERVAAAAAAWAVEQPGWPEETTRQLGERIRTVAGAATATFLAVREGGCVVARADLFVRDGIAQIEEVGTDPSARNRGLASALVREGVRRAGLAGAESVVLVADADDWPAGLYRRLGFADLGLTSSFAR